MNSGLPKRLRFAAAVEITPPRVVVFAIEIESPDRRQGLSSTVTAALPDLLQKLLECLTPRLRGTLIEPK